MLLTNEIKQAAQVLGQRLGAEVVVREYANLDEKAQQDMEVVALEKQYSQLFESLVDRQQNGEVLDRSEVDEYYLLKRQLQDHPLIAARDEQLTLVKALFVQTAQRLTNALGVEYSTFAG